MNGDGRCRRHGRRRGVLGVERSVCRRRHLSVQSDNCFDQNGRPASVIHGSRWTRPMRRAGCRAVDLSSLADHSAGLRWTFTAAAELTLGVISDGPVCCLKLILSIRDGSAWI